MIKVLKIALVLNTIALGVAVLILVYNIINIDVANIVNLSLEILGHVLLETVLIQLIIKERRGWNV